MMNSLVRFASVGLGTTTLDLVAFNLGLYGGLGTIAAHVTSSSLVLPISFLGQRRAFRSQGAMGRQALRFAAVTLLGVYVVQPIVLTLAMKTMVRQGIPQANAAKFCAMVMGIAWNFLWFRWYVFAPDSMLRRQTAGSKPLEGDHPSPGE